MVAFFCIAYSQAGILLVGLQEKEGMFFIRWLVYKEIVEEKEHVEGCPAMSTTGVDLPLDASDTFLKELQNK